jgi:hypothetical protein
MIENSINGSAPTYSSTLNDKISYKEKTANECEWVRAKVNIYNRYNNSEFFANRVEKFKINYDLYNGRMESSTQRVVGENLSMELGMPTIHEVNDDDFVHFPIIQQILNDLEGEEMKRPFNLRTVSTNVNSESSRNQKRKELLTEYVTSVVKQRLMEKVTKEQEGYLQKKIGEIQNLPQTEYYQKYQEIIDQHKQELENQVKVMTPVEIQTYMAKEFKLPEEQLSNEILQYHKRTDNLKNIFDRGWKDVLLTGEETYRCVDIRSKPELQLLNPLFLTYDKNAEIDYIDEAEWISYTEYLSKFELITRFDLDEKHIDNLNEHENGFVANNNNFNMLAWIELNPLNEDNTFNVKRYRTIHFVFKTLKKIKWIHRGDEKILVDETYKFNKIVDDKEEVTWLPEFWECTKICTTKPMYVKMGPLVNQFRNPNNPYDIRSCYTGIVYSSRNSQPISICDLGKPWQYIFNVVLNQTMDMIKSDIGKVLMANIKQIPAEYNPMQWMGFMKKYKMALVDTSSESAGPGVDPQYWKTIDLSFAQMIDQKLQLLEYIEKKIAQSMSYNPSRLGQQSPYETASANQSNITQSFNQTEKWFNLHQLMKERVTENFLDLAKKVYRDNPLITSYIMSDMSIATLNTEVADISNEYLRVFVSNSLRDTEMLSQLKSYMQPIIQNSNGDLRVVSEILTAETAGEIKNIISRIEDQKEQMQQQQAAQVNQAKQMELEKLQQIEAMKHKNQLEAIDAKGGFDIKVAEISVERFALAKDIDRDGVNDDIEKEKLKLEIENHKTTAKHKDILHKAEKETLKQQSIIKQNKTK